MKDDALWYEAAQVVGITNALNVVADSFGAGTPGLPALDPAAAPAEARACSTTSARSTGPRRCRRPSA
jgi:hypothetical protein